MTSIAIPAIRQTRKSSALWWIVPLLLLVVAAVAFLAVKYQYLPWQSGPPSVLGPFHTVGHTDLEIKIVQKGELQAVEYTDIKSDVEGTTQIVQIVTEGTTVNKGQVLLVLESSQIQLKKDEADENLKKAENALKIAEEMKGIQESQNAANKEAATVAAELAKIELQQYVEGTYPQQLQNAKTAMELARLNLKNKQEDQDQTRALFEKGFVTGAEVKKYDQDVLNATNEVLKAEKALYVLEKYQHTMDMARLNSNVAQTGQRMVRTLRENASTLNQRNVEIQDRQASVQNLMVRVAKLQSQLDACTIVAPQDGLVIYASSVDRNMREPIQEQASVKQGQWLLRLPDVRKMKAVLKIHENHKSKLDVEKNQRAMVKITGLSRGVMATLTKVAPVHDGGSRWQNPDLKEYPIELTLDHTPPGLKPGTSADCEIYIDRRDNVLALPLPAVYTVGRDAYVFVREGQGVKHLKVKIGATDELNVEVQEGLQPGEQALLLAPGQGRKLLEAAGVKVDESSRGSSGSGRGRRGQRGGGDAAPGATDPQPAPAPESPTPAGERRPPRGERSPEKPAPAPSAAAPAKPPA